MNRAESSRAVRVKHTWTVWAMFCLCMQFLSIVDRPRVILDERRCRRSSTAVPAFSVTTRVFRNADVFQSFRQF
eukprot:5100494-Pyramimonas_sp.AAC.1